MRLSAAFVALASALAVVASPVEKRTVSQSVFDDLVFYFQYASSAYASTCAKPNGNTLVQEFSNSGTDTQGFIARDDSRKEIVVSFRGSSSATDFLTDAEVLLTSFNAPGVNAPAGTSVHAGFNSAWNSVAAGVISTVQSQLAANPGYAIVTTGHSLGGALSSLAGITLQQNFPSAPIRMYTYGQPRTGNPTYATFVNDNFGQNMFRSVHTSDGVPTIIPQAVGYRHHAFEYWQSTDPSTPADVTQCDASGEDPACSDSIPSAGIDLAHTVYYNILATTPFCS